MFVKHEIDALGIATICFYHPQSNSLPSQLLQDLARVITDLGNELAVKVIVLRSEGERSFCAGASFDELMAIQNETEGTRFFSGFAHVINAMRTCPKIIIGRVQGKAVGGGVGLASAVDYCLATKHAAIKLSELAVGIGPFVVSPAIERKIGVSAMSQLAINATEWQTAEWAAQKGLYAQIYEGIPELDEAVVRLATKLATQANPEALRLMKTVFWENTSHWNTLLLERAAMSGKLVLSDYTRQAIALFKASAAK